MDYLNLTGPNGTEDNMGGLVTKAYYAPASYFTTISEPDENLSGTITDYALLVEINTAHTFAAGKGFHTIYNTQETGELKDERQGELDGYSIKTTVSFWYPGHKSDFLGWMTRAKNDRFIWLFKMPDGVVRQVGSDLFPAYVSPSNGGSGKGGAGRRGFEFTVTSYSSGPLIYTPAIALHP